MKWIPDRTGRFAQRPYYDEQELDAECETLVSDFLFDRHKRVEWPIRTDDLTVLIERLATDLDLYADLTSLGSEVEGVTTFARGVRPSVKISRTLSEAGNLENRVRTTLTHELGHVHFHSCLFDPDDEMPDLLGAGRPHGRQTAGQGRAEAANSTHSHQCRRETILDARETDWMEWQAGYACGAFLMPRSVLRKLVKDFGRGRSGLSPIVDGTEEGGTLVREVAQRFGVSTEAARIRLLKAKSILPAGRGVLYL